ncbi:hypothetical protein AVEN_269366-1 [Araneus ventricosus]|uniref:Uncharacterized protein n=1 Tax=Araneus ventricosus TaxID=182803 RepID=A0A4Y2JGR8_ARAVE|nr:hypothetical protein AVEN_269366-1 [Araneus ventricosus]
MLEKSVISWKCSGSISWTSYMYLPETKSIANVQHNCDLRRKCSAKVSESAITNIHDLREVHVQCLTVITTLQAVHRFCGILALEIGSTQLQRALEKFTIQY